MSHNKINIKINNEIYEVDSSQTILEAASKVGIDIPRLCYLEGIHEEGNCRVCSVEVNGAFQLKPACKTLVSSDMDIKTNTKRVYEQVSMNLELMASNHHFECFTCSREDNCELLDLLRRFSITNHLNDLHGYQLKKTRLNDTSISMLLDSSKCLVCGRCVSACQKYTGLGILNFNERGSKTYVGPALFHEIEDSGCIFCGKCIQSCPTGALREKDHIKDLEYALHDETKTVIVQVAPSVRAALGEEFGYPIGTNVEGQMFASLKVLGIKEIMDTNFTADLTIMEESKEFLKRFESGKNLPLFTSCSPGWVNYLETYYPEFIPNLSSCKSPQQMAGAIIKTYYANKLNKDPKDIVSVSIMPCIAKKGESKRDNMGRDGYDDVDIVLTTRELARLIKRRGIDFRNLAPERAYGKLASYTGAGVIFGASGGVMEAALRTVSETLVGKSAPLEFKEVRGKEGIKEASYTLNGTIVNIAVVQGGKAIGEFLEMLKTTDKKYHFVEFMGCIGGCINGGGQPIVKASQMKDSDIIRNRSKVLYHIDSSLETRKSHENPMIKMLYEEFLNPLGEKGIHDLLHTHYKEKDVYTK